MPVVLEHNVALFKNTRALDVNLFRAIDQNVVDRRILQKWFKRAESENLIQHLKRKPFTFAATQGCLEISN